MERLGLVLLVFALAIPALVLLARLLGIAYPVTLVLGGLALGFVPGLPVDSLRLSPDVVLLVFLPPLLYGAAFFSSVRELRAEALPISLLAVGLVLATIAAVAGAAHAVVPGLPWASAFVLGVVVAPTDPVAATAVARRIGLPTSVMTVVEGESLVNDAVALVAYKTALGAAVTGAFSVGHAGLGLVLGAAGGVAIGLVVGLLVSAMRSLVEDPPIETLLSIVSGFAAYLPADLLGASGVLAALTAALHMSWFAPHFTTPSTRLQLQPVWEAILFLANGGLFLLVGLQLPGILARLSDEGRSAGELALYAAVVVLVVVVVRMAWALVSGALTMRLSRGYAERRRAEPYAPWKGRVLVGWTGMRGVVSLAAALAVPARTAAGDPLPGHDLIIFVAFVVILATLVLQGLTLPALIHLLEPGADEREEREEVHARLETADAALRRLDELTGEDWARGETVDRMRGLYEFRRRRFGSRFADDADHDEDAEQQSQAYQRLVRELVGAQRHELVRLRRDRSISDETMRRIERELDLEEERLA